MKLSDVLSSRSKEQFFNKLSLEAYYNLPADLLTIFEGAGKEHRPYIIFDTLKVSPNFCSSIKEAAEQFWSMATTTAKVFQFLSEPEILDWGYPEDYIPLMLSDNAAPTEMRLDIAVDPYAFRSDRFNLSSFKVLEANAATPGFWSESFVFNELISNYLGKECPNSNQGYSHTEDFISYLKSTFPEYQHGTDTVYFSFPYVGNHEDILSFDARIGYFEQLGGKAKFIYSDDLVIETDISKEVSLLTPEGHEIKYLFFHYPNEWLMEDQGEELNKTELNSIPTARPWDYLQQLVLDKKLNRVPPISSEIIQNKAFFAFLWEGIHSQRFDPETTQVIKSLVPQTYCTYEEAKDYGLAEVWEKPIYGREGAGIILWGADGKTLIDTYDPEFDEDDWYKNMLAVFQENCEMPTYDYEDETLTLMFTVYLSATGKATGIGCRTVPKSKGAIDTKHGLWFPICL